MFGLPSKTFLTCSQEILLSFRKVAVPLVPVKSKPKLNNIFKRDNRNSISGNKIKKEPIINNISSNNYTQDEINENIDEVPLNQKTKYFSPSLEILETDNASAKKRLDKENIKANSNLLESVFQDFNISTFQHLSISAFQKFSTFQHFNILTFPLPYKISKFQH